MQRMASRELHLLRAESFGGIPTRMQQIFCFKGAAPVKGRIILGNFWLKLLGDASRELHLLRAESLLDALTIWDFSDASRELHLLRAESLR